MFRKFLAVSLGIVVLCLTAPTYGQLLVSSAEFVVPRQTFENSVSNLREVEVTVPILDGGGVTGSINANNFIVVTGSGQQAAGIDIVSGEGLLVPIADGSAAPFAFLLSNTNNQVTFGSLGSTVTLEGDLVTSVGYTGTDPISDLSASWGRGAEPVPFSVLPFGGAETIRVKTAFNLIDGQVVDYANAAYRGTIEAGSATGLPPDTPLDRVDPNNATAMFPGVGSLQVVHPTLGTFICTGSVIDDTHVLTAGHCFDLDNDGAVDAGVTAGTTFYLNDNGTPSATRAVSAVAIHPDFGGFSTSGANDDLAVVTLSSIVPPGTTTYPIRASGMSSGEVIEMVGYGISGQGDVGGIEVLPDLGVKRSGENEVDLFVVDDEGSGLDEIYIYDFDGPTGDGFLGGGTIGNDRETVVRGGDSGGPALVEVNGLPAIAGVNTFEFVLLGTTPPTGEFGVLGGGVLIDAPQFAWISSIATGATQAVVPEPSGLFTALSSLFALGFLRRRKSAVIRHNPACSKAGAIGVPLSSAFQSFL